MRPNCSAGVLFLKLQGPGDRLGRQHPLPPPSPPTTARPSLSLQPATLGITCQPQHTQSLSHHQVNSATQSSTATAKTADLRGTGTPHTPCQLSCAETILLQHDPARNPSVWTDDATLLEILQFRPTMRKTTGSSPSGVCGAECLPGSGAAAPTMYQQASSSTPSTNIATFHASDATQPAFRSGLPASHWVNCAHILANCAVQRHKGASNLTGVFILYFHAGPS